ncbi:hypothetical protein VTJ49DRAFT_7461 [Mycothermus thermophilus]|uniref:Uncharacterized protein n=1 Tax=Humicola insolens TaxID=85995 RepID=A0ABR3VI40_HUMIN
MLTIGKPAQYGYQPVHDLPTPPSTSRPSPPLTYPEPGQQPPLSTHGASNPSDQLMSAPHGRLPPPAALPPVPSPSGSGPSQPPSSLSGGQFGPPPPAHAHSQSLGQLPPGPAWNEESLRAWCTAKAEEERRRQQEEKTRQEEEKTRQESYRLEQRKMEAEILRTSLEGGIPPPLVPVVFAGMGGGTLSPVALEWAQQFMAAQASGQPAPALLPAGSVSSEPSRRDSHTQSYGQYPASAAAGGVPSTPGSAQGAPSLFASGYPGSPARPRGQSIPGAMTGRSLLSGAPHLSGPNSAHPGGSSNHHLGFSQSQPQQPQQEAQASPIYFHHWQPPTAQSSGGRSGADQPATPSGESPRKRKAPGSQPSAPSATGTPRQRSPPFAHIANPPPGRRRGHSRQRSDLGSYRSGPAGRVRAESSGPGREMSPMLTSGVNTVRDSGEPASSSSTLQQHQQQQQTQAPPLASPPVQGPSSSRMGPHSVSSLLSDHPPSPRAVAPQGHHHPPQQQQQHDHPMQHPHQPQFGENEQRRSPRPSEQ